MNNQIIYQVQSPPETSLLSRLCSCLSFLKGGKHHANVNNYQLGIDSPKSSFFGQRKLLVLDLDETLVHSQFQMTEGHDFAIEIIVQGQLFKVYVTIRPGAEAFIEQLSEFYDIILWTASLREYADPVMDFIDPNKRAIGRLYRESCTPIQQGLTKNLNKLGREMKDVIIVDNSAVSFCLNPENGFRIKDFFVDKSDRELEMLLSFFIWISQLPDVRPVSLLYQQYKKSSPEVLNSRQVGPLHQCFELKKMASISRSLSLQKARAMQSNQIIKTLTLSKDDDMEELDEEVIREKLGLNQSPSQEQIKQQNDETNEDDKETFVMAN